MGSALTNTKSLNCEYVVSKYPIGFPISSRVIPTICLKQEENVKLKYLRKWLNE